MTGFRKHAGLFLLAMATLIFEVLLTRVFSVTTWYHFAFLAISITLFGLALGGVIVYVKKDFFAREKTELHIAVSALCFGLFCVVATLVHLYCPFIVANANTDVVITVALFATLPFTLAAFVASGIGISLALTRYPDKVNSLYAADLLGAALGCIAVVLSLRYVDAITDVFVVALLSALSALMFVPPVFAQVRALAAAGVVAFSVLGAWQGITYAEQKPLLRIQWTKGVRQAHHNYELWNSFSRIRVWGDENIFQQADVYGLSPKYAPACQAKFLYLDIDGAAGTPILQFAGNLEPLKYLTYEVSNFAHHLRKQAKVLVIGAGGGKDILSALVHDQKHVTAVEINENIIKAVNQRYGSFSGRIIDHPRVTVVNDEARSFVTRSPDRFDIIQISMIDTWAATASGAYSLSENGLYTEQSFRALLNHLTERGILTVSRWYAKSTPAEFYRLTALAAKTLKSLGVEHPENHIIAVRNMPLMQSGCPDGVGTLLVSRSPFSAEDVAAAAKTAAEMQFDIVYASGVKGADPLEAQLAAGEDPDVVASALPFNLNAPSDDNPFFFQTISLKHVFANGVLANNMNTVNVMAGVMLLVSAFATAGLSYFCLRIPYVMTEDKQAVREAMPLFLYFFAIGTGFMFIEISQIERLSLVLGHPVYGLSVVLFALLLSTGLGSYWCQGLLCRPSLDYRLVLVVNITVLLLYAAISPLVLDVATGYSTLARIGVAVALLFPVGVVLGTNFPLGMKMTVAHNEALSPWLWGINGAASVFASVLAVVVAMFSSISASYMVGVGSYVLALVAIQMLLGKRCGVVESAS